MQEINNFEKKWEVDRQRKHGNTKGLKPLAKVQRKSTKKATGKNATAVEPIEISDNTTAEADKVGEVKKPRGKAPAKKKAPAAKVKAAVVEEDDGISDLRARLEAYNFDSSPDRSEEMGSELPLVQTKNKPANRRVASGTNEVEIISG